MKQISDKHICEGHKFSTLSHHIGILSHSVGDLTIVQLTPGKMISKPKTGKTK